MEAELASTRAALASAEAEGRLKASGAYLSEEGPLSALIRTLMKTFSAASMLNSGRETTGLRDWNPPTWDHRAETCRDDFLRLRSLYCKRSAVKPTLSTEDDWDPVDNTLPSRERARMRPFWGKGSPISGKDPEAFFAQRGHILADSNEQSKALEQLINLRHHTGQPWHEHQRAFDGLLLTAGGDSWTDSTKIGHLKNTFSNSAKISTAIILNSDDYGVFSEEVERIMTNLETTDQFKAANQRWSKEKNKDSVLYITATAKSQGPSTVTTVTTMDDYCGRRRGHGHGSAYARRSPRQRTKRA